jgi:protochlorophyllide reductase
MSSIPDQSGRTAVVTGATGGLGLRVAVVLASRGARVLLTSRNPVRGTDALAFVRAAATGPEPEIVDLDVSDLASVRAAASDIGERTNNRVDLLINNAGVMAPPLTFVPLNSAHQLRDFDRIELQWATNVVGPAALTWLLLPALEAVPASRVVFVSSDRHRRAAFDEARLRRDIRGENYRGFDYYGRTKLADLLLSRELDKYFQAHGIDSMSVAAHPGFTATDIVRSGFAGLPRFAHRIATAATGVLGQSVAMGALPILYAATNPHVHGSRYFGPTQLFELRGPPGPATRSARSESDELGGLVVRLVEDLTGITAPS